MSDIRDCVDDFDDKQELVNGIPAHFERQWGVSDVILLTNNSDEPLHVNRAVMATFSPVFRAMFFSNFSEIYQDSVKLDVDYYMMKEILRVLHSFNRNYGTERNYLYSLSFLVKAYVVADKYDIPSIRELCNQQLSEYGSPDALNFALKMNLEDVKSAILKKMSYDDLECYLKNRSENMTLSPDDVMEIMNKRTAEKNEQDNGEFGFGIFD